MVDISQLPDPNTNEFQYWGHGVAPSRILIGRTFLAGAYYKKYRNNEEKKKYNYG